MTAFNFSTHSTLPYILICGSYLSNKLNDKLCTILGSELAKCNIRIISGGSKPGIKVAVSFYKMLSDLDLYKSDKIITV